MGLAISSTSAWLRCQLVPEHEKYRFVVWFRASSARVECSPPSPVLSQQVGATCQDSNGGNQNLQRACFAQSSSSPFTCSSAWNAHESIFVTTSSVRQSKRLQHMDIKVRKARKNGIVNTCLDEVMKFFDLQKTRTVLVVHHKTKFEHVRGAETAKSANCLDEFADKCRPKQTQQNNTTVRGCRMKLLRMESLGLVVHTNEIDLRESSSKFRTYPNSSVSSSSGSMS